MLNHAIVSQRCNFLIFPTEKQHDKFHYVKLDIRGRKYVFTLHLLDTYIFLYFLRTVIFSQAGQSVFFPRAPLCWVLCWHLNCF